MSNMQIWVVEVTQLVDKMENCVLKNGCEIQTGVINDKWDDMIMLYINHSQHIIVIYK